jgi:hypothetical protein
MDTTLFLNMRVVTESTYGGQVTDFGGGGHEYRTCSTSRIRDGERCAAGGGVGLTRFRLRALRTAVDPRLD